MSKLFSNENHYKTILFTNFDPDEREREILDFASFSYITWVAGCNQDTKNNHPWCNAYNTKISRATPSYMFTVYATTHSASEVI